MSILTALKRRLQIRHDCEVKRIKLARIINEHFKKNGYGHNLFKNMNVVTEDKSEKENKNGKP